LSGAVVGGFAHRLYTIHGVEARREVSRNPQEYRKRYVEDMKRRLHLSEAQVTQLGTVLDETRTRYRDLHERFKPEMRAIQDDQTQKIRALLDSNQQAEYEKWRQEREKRRNKQDGGKYGGY
jgi:hypothetical protein